MNISTEFYACQILILFFYFCNMATKFNDVNINIEFYACQILILFFYFCNIVVIFL